MSFNNAPGFKAGGTIAPSRFCKIDNTQDGAVVQAVAGDYAPYVSQEGMKRTPGLAGSDNTIAAEANDVLRVYSPGDVCPLTIGAAVTRGDPLKSDASGRGITAAVAADNAMAIALQSGGAAGAVILVQLMYRKI